MDLYEYEGKALFKEYKIPVPKSILKKYILPKKLPAENLILKAQVLHGKRRKQGLILATTKKKIKQDVNRLRKKTQQSILIEEQLEIAKEYYLSITINQSKGCYSLLFSEAGGINIEEIPKNKIKKIDFLQFPKKEIQKITKNKIITAIAQKLFQIFKEKDATLVEVNPLAEVLLNQKSSHERSEYELFCLDAKITIDDNALYRQQEIEKINTSRKTAEEKEAEKYGIHYIPLDGNIGVIGNGAGLVMATLDLLQQNNLKPANFLDAAGGTTKAAMMHALSIIKKQKKCKAIFVNMFGGITETDEVAKAIIAFKEKEKPKIPLIIRLYGTHYQKAQEMLKKKNISVYKTMPEAIRALAERLK